jgi:hypothetical protein
VVFTLAVHWVSDSRLVDQRGGEYKRAAARSRSSWPAAGRGWHLTDHDLASSGNQSCWELGLPG